MIFVLQIDMNRINPSGSKAKKVVFDNLSERVPIQCGVCVSKDKMSELKEHLWAKEHL